MVRFDLLTGMLLGAMFLARADDAQAQQPTIRDSAGVRVLEHATFGSGLSSFTVSSTPTLAFGGVSTDLRLEFTGGSARRIHSLSDGRMLIEDKDHVKMFDSRGQFQRAIGGPGQGPGEFIQVTAACVLSRDTILVFETGRHVNTFDGTGKFIKADLLHGAALTPNHPCFSDGTSVEITSPGANLTSELPLETQRSQDPSRALIHHRRDGSIRDTLALLPVVMNVHVPRNVEIAVRDTMVYVNQGESGYRVYSITGRLISVVRSRDALEPISDQTPKRTTGVQAVRPGSTAPQTIPAFAQINVDNSGRVWLTQHPYNAKATGWTVFSPTGVLLGTVARPKLAMETSSIVLTGFHGEDVVLLWRDLSDGAFHVSSHRLLPAAR